MNIVTGLLFATVFTRSDDNNNIFSYGCFRHQQHFLSILWLTASKLGNDKYFG